MSGDHNNAASEDTTMTTYRCDDGNAEIIITAATPRDAAQEYVDGGDWNAESGTTWVDVHVWTDDGEVEETISVRVDPEEPECSEDAHDWQSPYEIVGGIRENPGVWGKGGGAVITEVCVHCGCAKVTDTWATGPGGQQGYTSVSYEAGRYAEDVAAPDEVAVWDMLFGERTAEDVVAEFDLTGDGLDEWLGTNEAETALTLERGWRRDQFEAATVEHRGRILAHLRDAVGLAVAR